MKIIESAGGPLIGLSRCDLQEWSGIEGKRFIGEAAPFSNDYEAVGSAMFGGRRTVGRVAKIAGSTHEGLLVNLPRRTLVVASDDLSVHLAQIWSSEANWSESMIMSSYFDQGKKEENVVSIRVKAGGFMLFDSACPSTWLEDDLLFVDLLSGLYMCESAIWQIQGQANLIIIRMKRNSSES